MRRYRDFGAILVLFGIVMGFAVIASDEFGNRMGLLSSWLHWLRG